MASSTLTVSNSSISAGKGLRVTLWSLQGLLAVFFLMAGYNHGLAPLAEAATRAPWVADTPAAVTRFAGFAELAGALGLLLPALTRIRPVLTPIAALGLTTIMLLAVPFHVMRGEANVIGLHIIVAGIAGFVAWGRLKKAPIEPR